MCRCRLIRCARGAALIFAAWWSGFSLCLWLVFHYLLHVTSFPLPLLLLDKEWNMGDDLLYLSSVFSHPGLVFSKSLSTLLLSATHDREQQSNKRLIYSSLNPDQPRFTREALSFPFIANTHQRTRVRSRCKMKQSQREITLCFCRTGSDKGNKWTCLRCGSSANYTAEQTVSVEPYVVSEKRPDKGVQSDAVGLRTGWHPVRYVLSHPKP